MARRQRNDLFAARSKERVITDEKRTGSTIYEGGECRFDVAFATSGANLTLGSRALALNPAKNRHCRRTQAYDFHH
jgi:hypothetical protein